MNRRTRGNAWWITAVSVGGGLILIALIAAKRMDCDPTPVPDPTPPIPQPDPPPLPGAGFVVVIEEGEDRKDLPRERLLIVGDPAVRLHLESQEYVYHVIDKDAKNEFDKPSERFGTWIKMADSLPWLIVTDPQSQTQHSGPLPLTLAEFWKVIEEAK